MPKKLRTRNVISGNIDPMKNVPDDFEKAAGTRQTGVMREIAELLRHNKKWWLVPVIIALLTVGVLIAISVVAPSVAPFIYPFF